MRIIVSGGGTGGHIFPLYAVTQELRAQTKRPEILWIGSKNGPEKDFADRHGIAYDYVAVGKFRRYTPSGLDFGGDPASIGQNILDAIKLPFGIIQAYFRIADFAPDVIFSKGGYVSLPVVIAGRLLSIPVIIHESDALPGLSNRIAARFATTILTGFSETKKYFGNSKNVHISGNPVRNEILNGNREKAYGLFHLMPTRPVVLIMGGSLGSSRINQVVMGAIESILSMAQVIHLTGDFDWIKIAPHAARLEPKGYRAFPHLTDNMAHALALADVVVTRAGANSISELSTLGKPMIIIPLDSSTGGHQMENAKVYAKHNAAVILPEPRLDGEALIQSVRELLTNSQKRAELSANAKELSHAAASRTVVKEILKSVSSPRHAQQKHSKHLSESV